jgi:hypothetical protein
MINTELRIGKHIEIYRLQNICFEIILQERRRKDRLLFKMQAPCQGIRFSGPGNNKSASKPQVLREP